MSVMMSLLLLCYDITDPSTTMPLTVDVRPLYYDNITLVTNYSTLL